MHFLLVLSPVLAQDLFLAQRGPSSSAAADDLPKLGNHEETVHSPQRGGQIGCGNSCDSGDDFDHWNDKALNGGISKICFRVGSPKWIHSEDWITGATFCYAGNCVSQGHSDTSDCFSLTEGEAITELTATTGCVPNGANHWGVSSITVKTTGNRQKKWGGRECSQTHQLKAPPGKHITSFWGRASSDHVGWDGLLSKIGVYYDVGIASGRWVQIAGGPGVNAPTFTYQSCTSSSSSRSVSATSEWSVGTSSEISFGFELEGISAGRTQSITGSYSHSVTSGTESSFTTSQCQNINQTCAHGQNYAFQFVFNSNFDGLGMAETQSNHWVCTDRPEVCCLPTFFKNPHKASDGCKEGSPNVCG